MNLEENRRRNDEYLNKLYRAKEVLSNDGGDDGFAAKKEARLHLKQDRKSSHIEADKMIQDPNDILFGGINNLSKDTADTQFKQDDVEKLKRNRLNMRGK